MIGKGSLMQQTTVDLTQKDKQVSRIRLDSKLHTFLGYKSITSVCMIYACKMIKKGLRLELLVPTHFSFTDID